MFDFVHPLMQHTPPSQREKRFLTQYGGGRLNGDLANGFLRAEGEGGRPILDHSRPVL